MIEIITDDNVPPTENKKLKLSLNTALTSALVCRGMSKEEAGDLFEQTYEEATKAP